MKKLYTAPLRSPKVRDILDKPPKSLVLGGLIAIILIFLLVILAMVVIPYPYGSGESIFHHIL